MKNLLTILLCVACLCANAQTDREILLDISKQVTKLNEQMTINNTKIEALEKNMIMNNTKLEGVDKRLDGMDKRLDFMQMLLLILIPLIITSVLGVIGFILWDRKTVTKPIEDEMKKEFDKIKEKEQKLEDRLETALKKIAQIDPRFSGVI